VSGGHPIRLAERADVLAIVRLLADDPLGRVRDVPHEPLAEEYWAAYEAIAADPNNELVVLDLDGAVVGCLQLTFIPGLSRKGALRAQIEAVRVASHVRGRGLGRALFLWAIGRAREKGCAVVQLTSDKTRPDAHRFYASLGFVASHEGLKLVL
jgi:GNAT superfamily N-acetyltransferase